MKKQIINLAGFLFIMASLGLTSCKSTGYGCDYNASAKEAPKAYDYCFEKNKIEKTLEEEQHVADTCE